MRLSVLASTAVVALLVPLPAGVAQQSEQDPVITPANIVVLVDESSSIKPDDMQREREAAAVIALGEFAPGSTVTVAGFGSNNGQPGQKAVNEVCPPSKVASAQDQQRLSDCVKQLHSRTAAEGDGTDHAAALQQALNHLSGQKDGAKLVFLLTDGKLNVEDSPGYAPDNVGDQRNRIAAGIIDTLLVKAREEQVQIWPLGFGDVDGSRLEQFAKSAYQGKCGARSPTPSAAIVRTSADVEQVLLKAFGAARCAGIGDIQRTTVGSGSTQTAEVVIPVIATDGSIVVTKHDSRISVSYVDPNGTTVPKNGKQDESTFQVSGENGSVEALRIVNPLPGKWKVQISSTPDVPRQDVSTVVMYQGAVRSTMILNPPSPRAGQEVTVALSLQTRTRSITDPAVLKELSFTAEAAGTGFTTPISLNDEARDGDDKSQDGVYTGKVVVPAEATGSVKFTGTIAGVGISGDTRSVEAPIVQGPPALTASSTFGNSDREVAPGGSMKGEVTVTNNSGRARKARIIATDPAPGTLVSIPGEQTVLDLPPSGNSTFDFDLLFADDTVPGPNAVTLKVVDDEKPDDVIYEWRLTANVVKPTSPVVWFVIAAAVIALAALAGFVVWRRQRDVRGLVVHLYEGHRPRGDLAAPEQPSRTFRFTLTEAAPGVPLLTHSTGGDDTYVLRRTGGRLRLVTPYGEDTRCHVGDLVDVTPALAIKVLDEHAPVAFTDEQDPLTTQSSGDSGLL
ncbi:vWA domain-containing protein [Lentzea kentuckyensis]|uniref:vWA domain-containing protein n=1 Tax=Lentzea kentuckyensis TaxID=360086 RepID=UPI000A36195F|nr:vWA domain-containing protein [Lentzea kentuckyensis]